MNIVPNKSDVILEPDKMVAVDRSPLALPQDDLQNVLNLVGVDNWNLLRNKLVFITGGTGFVGKWLLGALLFANDVLDLNCTIIALSRNPEIFLNAFPNLKNFSNLKFIKGDVKNFSSQNLLCDYIIHAATDVINSGEELDILDTCIDGTKQVLELARKSKVKSFLLVSSGAIYGKGNASVDGFLENTPTAPLTTEHGNAYGQGKRIAEYLCTCYANEYGIPSKIARCFAFIGPHLPLDKHFAIGNFVQNVLRSKDIIIKGDGTPYRSYLYASDMVAWLLKILFNGQKGQAYNVGSAQAFSIAELAKEVVNSLGTKTNIEILTPADTNKTPERYCPNVTKIKTQLGMRETISLQNSIKKYADWCKRNTKC